MALVRATEALCAVNRSVRQVRIANVHMTRGNRQDHFDAALQ
jgi:hypothetical protein